MNKSIHRQLSICCPVFNEEAMINKCLSSILQDSFESGLDFELIILLSGCTDNTEKIIRSNFGCILELALIVEPTRKGKADAVDRLLSLSTAELVIFTDGDTIWKKGSIYLLMQTICENENIGIVSGRVTPIDNGNKLIDITSKLSFYYWHKYRLKMSLQHNLWSVSGQIYITRKKMASSLSQNIINEDALIGLTAHLNGYLVVYNPRCAVSVNYPITWSDYFTQKIRTRIGWEQLKRINKSISIPHLEIRELIIDDIVNAKCNSRTCKIFLLVLDIFCFCIAKIIILLSSPTKYLLWKRIKQ